MQWIAPSEKDTATETMLDWRADALIRASAPTALTDNVSAALSGPPDPVIVRDNRYVSVSACVVHACSEKGFFWIDSRTGVALA